MLIRLDHIHVERAKQVGIRRNDHNRTRIRDQKVDKNTSAEQTNIIGATAEVAIAEMTGYEWYDFQEEFWKDDHQDRKPDVGPLEVRVNNRKHPVQMLLYQQKNPQMRPYVLCVIESPTTVRVAGWRFGFECRKERYLKANWARPCYGVPESDLHGLCSLHNWCRDVGWDEWPMTEIMGDDS